MVRTNIVLDEKLVREAMKLANVKTKREIVDLPAAPVLRVEQLMIEDVEPEVDRLGQF